jgi:hypothetical protein
METWRLAEVRKRLEKLHGRPPRPPARDPWLLILWENVAYLADDARRQAAFDLLRRRVGTKPKELLAASDEALLEVAGHGILAETFAAKLRECATLALDLFPASGGDVAPLLEWPLERAARPDAARLCSGAEELRRDLPAGPRRRRAAARARRRGAHREPPPPSSPRAGGLPPQPPPLRRVPAADALPLRGAEFVRFAARDGKIRRSGMIGAGRHHERDFPCARRFDFPSRRQVVPFAREKRAGRGEACRASRGLPLARAAPDALRRTAEEGETIDGSRSEVLSDS